MARSQPSRESAQRGGVLPLAVAWLLVLAVTVIGGGFIAWQYDAAAPRLGNPVTVVLPSAPEFAEPEAPTETAGVTVDPVEREGALDAAEQPDLASTSLVAPSYEGPPQIAVVVAGLGLAVEPTESAIDRLPAGITLSFSPYSEALDQWIPRARAMGHEVMIDLPMEPESFPLDDPGPQALLTGIEPEDNLRRLRWFLDKGRDYSGVAMHMGSRFVESRDHLEPILNELRARGILFLDNGSSEASVAGQLARELSLPFAANDRTIDDGDANREAINARLVQVERIALTDGSAVAMAQPFPVTVDRLANWAASLEARGFALVPLSVLADREHNQQAREPAREPPGEPQ